MNLYITLGVIAISMSSFSNAEEDWKKNSGWKSISIYAAEQGVSEKDLKDITPNTLSATWAGRLTNFYWDKNQSRVTNVKAKVTWSSDIGKQCNTTVDLPIENIKDFNFRSVAMYKCK